MRALSLTQPWPWIIFNLGKDVENRVWTTKHRGPFLIHASKGYSKAKWMAAYDWIAQHVGTDTANMLPEWDEDDVLFRGGIVGVASIHDVIGPCEGWMGNDGPCRRRWHMHEQHGFLLRNVRPLPFLAVPGRQRWFDVDHPALANEAP